MVETRQSGSAIYQAGISKVCLEKRDFTCDWDVRWGTSKVGGTASDLSKFSHADLGNGNRDEWMSVNVNVRDSVEAEVISINVCVRV